MALDLELTLDLIAEDLPAAKRQAQTLSLTLQRGEGERALDFYIPYAAQDGQVVAAVEDESRVLVQRRVRQPLQDQGQGQEQGQEGRCQGQEQDQGQRSSRPGGSMVRATGRRRGVLALHRPAAPTWVG